MGASRKKVSTGPPQYYGGLWGLQKRDYLAETCSHQRGGWPAVGCQNRNLLKRGSSSPSPFWVASAPSLVTSETAARMTLCLFR